MKIKITVFKNQYLLNLFVRKYRSSIDKENATSSEIVFPVPRYRFPLQKYSSPQFHNFIFVLVKSRIVSECQRGNVSTTHT